MAEGFSLSIDDDWKAQAQAEKERLVEAEREKAAAKAAAAAPAPVGGAGTGARGGKEAREMPPASFEGLVGTLAAQAGMYLGEYAGQTGRPVFDLDMARYQLDLLWVLEQRTEGKLSGAEKLALDTTLYDLRGRFVSVAAQMLAI
jgi:Domain of unknown function (DUF1844)